MRRLISGIFVLFAFSAFAQADDLNDAFLACQQHEGTTAAKRQMLAPTENTPKWESGWEHCDKIAQAAVAAQKEAQRIKAQSDLAKTKALADQLGKK